MISGDWRPFRLVPEDVLFFRDGKPASMGADHYLRSLFPPFPLTLYGAIRTGRLLDAGVDLSSLTEATWRTIEPGIRKELGEWGRFGTFGLRGPWLVRNEEVLLPAPADLGVIEAKHARERRAEAVVRFLFSQNEDNAGSWSHPLALASPFSRKDGRWTPYKSPNDQEPGTAAGWYLTPAGVDAWSRGDVPEPTTLVHDEDLWAFEVRTGVGLDKHRRQAAEHMLYTFGYVRLAPGVSLGFEVRGSGLTWGGWLRLGGDGRPARVEQPAPSFPALSGDALGHDGRAFMLALATPMLSEAGVYPPGFGADCQTAALDGIEATLVGALVRSPVVVGGWNMAAGQPKPLRRAVPAGSVFGFETRGGGTALSSLHGTNIAGFPDDRLSQQGFGLALIGAMPRKDA